MHRKKGSMNNIEKEKKNKKCHREKNDKNFAKILRRDKLASINNGCCVLIEFLPNVVRLFIFQFFVHHLQNVFGDRIFAKEIPSGEDDITIGFLFP